MTRRRNAQSFQGYLEFDSSMSPTSRSIIWRIPCLESWSASVPEFECEVGVSFQTLWVNLNLDLPKMKKNQRIKNLKKYKWLNCKIEKVSDDSLKHVA